MTAEPIWGGEEATARALSALNLGSARGAGVKGDASIYGFISLSCTPSIKTEHWSRVRVHFRHYYQIQRLCKCCKTQKQHLPLGCQCSTDRHCNVFENKKAGPDCLGSNPGSIS